MTRVTATLLMVAVALVATGITWSARRIAALERHEFEHEGKAQPLADARQAKGSTAVSARLDRVELRADDNAFFEVCSSDGMPDGKWLGTMDFVVFQLEPLKLLLRVPLDKEHLEVVRRNSRGACLTLGGGPLEAGGAHAVDAVWPGKPFPEALAPASVRVRVLARHPLTRADRAPVLLIAGGALLLLLALYAGRVPHSPLVASSTTSRTMLALVGGFAVMVAGWLASAYLGPFGPTWGLLKTVALGAAEVAAAFVFSRLALGTAQPVSSWLLPSSRAALSLVRSDRAPWLALASAPLFGLLLMFTATFALRLVPSTGESAIETFISWPSGMLAFGTIGVLVPVCEEVFFRGFVYGRALLYGKLTAFVLTVVSFVAIHAAQTWGNWGSLLSITITGLVLTALRAGTGSTLIPAIAHLVYNLGLTLRSL